MNIIAKPRRSNTDVALANFSTYIPFSDQVITIRDLGVHTQENLLPKRPDYLTVKSDSSGFLKFKNTFSEVELTNIYGFDALTFETSPLWYKYSFTYAYYNKTKLRQKTSKRIDITKDNRKIERMTANKDHIILNGSVTLKYVDSNNVQINYTNQGENTRFIVDYGRKDVTYIANNFDGLEPTGTLTAIFDTITSDIEVDLDEIHDYLLAAQEFDDNTYLITLYSTFQYPIKVKYTTIIDDQIQIREEVAHFEPVFIQTTTLQDISQNNIFVSNDDKIQLKQFDTFTQYAVRQKILVNTRIHLMSPIHLPRQEQWFLRTTENQFIKDQLTYKVTDNDLFTKRPYFKYEQPIIVDEHHIKLSQMPQFVKHKDETIGGINIFDGDSTYTATEIDLSSNVLTIREAISAKKILTANYRYDDDTLIVRKFDFNPRNSNKTGFSLLKKVCVVFILPQEQLINPNDAIFIGFLNRYEMGSEIKYDDSDILELMTPQEVLPIVANYVNTIHISPIALAVITIDNVYLPRIATITDIRVRGGGVHSLIDETEKLSTDDIYSQLDISTYDGELYDLGGVIIFDIPESIYNRIETLIKETDPEVFYDYDLSESVTKTFFAEDKKAAKLKAKVENFFINVIEKRKPIGKRAIINYPR